MIFVVSTVLMIIGFILSLLSFFPELRPVEKGQALYDLIINVFTGTGFFLIGFGILMIWG